MANEKVKMAFEKIENGLENITNSAEWQSFLKFQSKFYKYSFNNAMLIYLQKPSASFVKGFKAWGEFDRKVKKGAKGIEILAPCFRKKKADKDETEEERILAGFRTTYVFDIADTEGDDSKLPTVITGLKGDNEEYEKLYKALVKAFSKTNEIIEIAGMGGPKGTFNIQTKQIKIEANTSFLQKVKTVIHEYAHYIDYEISADSTIEKSQREVVAESAAYIVSDRLGLDTSNYSFVYIQSWLEDKEQLKKVGELIQKVANKILTVLAGSEDLA